MKINISILLVITTFSPYLSQDKLVELDKDLATVNYSFEVKFHPLKS